MIIETATERIVTTIYNISPYRILDRRYEAQQKAAIVNQDCTEENRMIVKRYSLSEYYIVGWFGLSILLLAINELLPALLVYILMWRVIGILSKEVCVVLFKKCKITEGNNVSSPGRVIVLAFINYVTSGLLFALLYTKEGQYQIDPDTVVTTLPIGEAILQGLSIPFTFSPAYEPLNFNAHLITIAQSGFSFVFVGLVIAVFVGLIGLKSKAPKDSVTIPNKEPEK